MSKNIAPRKRTTFKEIKELLELEGYKIHNELDDTVFVKTVDYLEVTCPDRHRYRATWASFKKGCRCKKCKGNSKLEYKDVKTLLEKEGYILQSRKYLGSKAKLITICPKGHQWEMRIGDFKKGHRCSKCGGTRKLTLNEVSKYINEQGYKIVSDSYKNTKEKILVQCDKSHVYETTFSSFRSGRRCKECRKEKLSKKFRLDYVTVKQNVESVKGYKLLSKDYINSKTKLKIQHVQGECNNCIFEMTYSNFYRQNQRCPKCNGAHCYSHEEIAEEICKIDNEYRLCDDSPFYRNNSTKLKLYHEVCGKTFFVSWNKFKGGQKPCGCHSYSYGESRIAKYLDFVSVEYVKEQEFDGLLSDKNKNLRYDFGIFENKELKILIEFDGGLHFKPVKHYGGTEYFNRIKKHDQIKNQYCKDNNIPLIRIPYWDFDNIETILEKELTALGIIREESAVVGVRNIARAAIKI